MASNDLFAEIWGSPGGGGPEPDTSRSSPSRRRRSGSPLPAADRRPLFHSDDEDDDERSAGSPKRKKAKLTELPPELDAYFPPETDDADLDFSFADKGADLAKLTKEAEARHSRKLQQSSKATQQGKTTGSQATGAGKGKAAAGSSAINPLAIGLSDDEGDDSKGDKGSGEKKRKPLPKLDEARLLGDNGFRALVAQTKNFKVHNPKGKDPKKDKLSSADLILPKQKDPEFANLSRFIEMTQLWAHRMYPKGQFSDTVERVEKLCHSRRMVTAMSVWKDEYKNGPLSSRIHEPSSPPADNADEEVDDDGTYTREVDAEGRPIGRAASSRASSRPPTMPTSSGASEIDDADLDAIMAHMARSQASSSTRVVGGNQDDDMEWDLADEIEAQASSSTKQVPKPSKVTQKHVSAEEEEAAMWAEIGGDEDELMAFMDSFQEAAPSKPTAPQESRTPSLSHSASPTANNATDREETGMNVDAPNVPPDIRKQRE
ncbi:hypothetical protein FRC00_004680, partial [Tulasnella sp. 408]